MCSTNGIFIVQLYEWLSFVPGKMFKSAELPYLVQFFQMFFNDKPVDWLLDHLISTKYCNWDKSNVSIKSSLNCNFVVECSWICDAHFLEQRKNLGQGNIFQLGSRESGNKFHHKFSLGFSEESKNDTGKAVFTRTFWCGKVPFK